MANPLDQVASWPATAAAGVASAAGLLESARPAERPYRWASVTKLLVALAALDAVQRGLREPQSGLAQLGALVDSVRSTGLPVTLQVDGEPSPDSAAVGPSVYRIVQESLTNVLKHAGDARVSVRMSCGATAVDVVVKDDGPGRSATGAAPPGYGLAGMRERAALFGGTFSAGNRVGGGFAVRAHLPLPQPL